MRPSRTLWYFWVRLVKHVPRVYVTQMPRERLGAIVQRREGRPPAGPEAPQLPEGPRGTA